MKQGVVAGMTSKREREREREGGKGLYRVTHVDLITYRESERERESNKRAKTVRLRLVVYV